MIAYQLEPISVGDASKLKAWLSTAESHLFTQCVLAELNERYFEAINIQCKADGLGMDDNRFNKLSEAKLDEARNMRTFIELFTKFSKPEYGFHKLKVNT